MAAAPLAVTIVAAALVTDVVVHQVVLGQVDASLRQRADGTRLGVGRQPPSFQGGVFQAGGVFLEVQAPPDPGGPGGLVQAVDAAGRTARPSGQVQQLPVSDRDRLVAAGSASDGYRYAFVGRTPVRIYTAHLTTGLTTGLAIQVARPLTEANSVLDLVQLSLFVVSAAGVGLAAILGRVIAQAALIPIGRLRGAVDHVTETRDMSRRVPDEGSDELGRLGSHFNRMLGALEQSLRMQRQLVADASHELRTPLASLRTNIEVLQRSPDLPAPDRDRLLKDVVAQIEQLTRLIQDLIDLARGDQTPEEQEEVRLDWIVAAAVERAAINWPQVRFETDMAETAVVAQANRLDRAISNLLDNAGKWSPPGGVVEVGVADHQVTVRDHGAGIAPDDLPFVFDRFWRAPAARSLPGSGLGLSIVRQVAESHRAVATAELPEGGGTLMRLTFPDS